MTLTVGFFGDSFCSEKQASNYQTYISKFANNYEADIVSLGQAGSSISDVLLIQLQPFLKLNKFPDICVFVWTGLGRLYNRKVRNINSWSAERSSEPGLWNASKEYFKYLHDQELDELQYVALLHYIDLVVLPKIPSTTKVIHLWAFGKPASNTKEYFRLDNFAYHYRWTRGVEIRPALVGLSLFGHKTADILGNDVRANHIEGEDKNNILFNWLRDAVDNYEDGRLITGSL